MGTVSTNILTEFRWPLVVDLAHELLPLRDLQLEDGEEGGKIEVPRADGSMGVLEPIMLDEIHLVPSEEDAKLTAKRLETMAGRIERVTSWLIWQAFSGEIVLDYEDGQLKLTYPRPELNDQTATPPWTAEGAPIESDLADLLEWFPGSRIIMNSRTADTAIKNGLDPKTLAVFKCEICDQGFIDESGDKEYVRFVEDGVVYALPRDEPVGFMANTDVKIIMDDEDDEDQQKFWHGMGPVASEFYQEEGHFVRVTAYRIPVITKPERIFRGVVYKEDQ